MTGRDIYSGLSFEYPPLSLLPILIPGWLCRVFSTNALSSYLLCFRWEMFVVDATIFFFLRKIVPSALYIVAPFFLAPVLYDRFDLVVALVISYSIFLYMRGRSPFFVRNAIGLGFFLKLTPIFAAPALAQNYFFKKKIRNFSGGFLLSVAICFCLAMGLFGKSFFGFLEYHLSRGIQLESTWASFLILFQKSGLQVVNRFGSAELGNGINSSVVLMVSVTVMLVTLLRSFFRIRHQRKIAIEIVTVFFSFFVASKVFSPQYLLWVAPVFPFLFLELPKKRAWEFSLLFATVCLLSGVILANYDSLVLLNRLLVTILFVRNVICLFLYVVLFLEKGSSTN